MRYHGIPAGGKNPPESALRIGDILFRKKYRADTRFCFAMYDRISSRKSVRFSCGIPCVLYNISKSTLAGLRLSRVIFDSKQRFYAEICFSGSWLKKTFLSRFDFLFLILFFVRLHQFVIRFLLCLFHSFLSGLCFFFRR